MTDMRMTTPLLDVLTVLLADGQQWYGRKIAATAGLGSGTVYPILARLEKAGWATSRWEPMADWQAADRPRRRLYALTATGRQHATAAVRTRQERQRRAGLTTR